MPENQNHHRLTCHKHGEAPYLIVEVPGHPLKFWCLVCIEDVFTKWGVHAMFPSPLGKTDSGLLDEWPVEIEEVK